MSEVGLWVSVALYDYDIVVGILSTSFITSHVSEKRYNYYCLVLGFDEANRSYAAIEEGDRGLALCGPRSRQYCPQTAVIGQGGPVGSNSSPVGLNSLGRLPRKTAYHIHPRFRRSGIGRLPVRFTPPTIGIDAINSAFSSRYIRRCRNHLC